MSIGFWWFICLLLPIWIHSQIFILKNPRIMIWLEKFWIIRYTFLPNTFKEWFFAPLINFPSLFHIHFKNLYPRQQWQLGSCHCEAFRRKAVAISFSHIPCQCEPSMIQNWDCLAFSCNYKDEIATPDCWRSQARNDRPGALLSKMITNFAMTEKSLFSSQ